MNIQNFYLSTSQQVKEDLLAGSLISMFYTKKYLSSKSSEQIGILVQEVRDTLPVFNIQAMNQREKHGRQPDKTEFNLEKLYDAPSNVGSDTWQQEVVLVTKKYKIVALKTKPVLTTLPSNLESSMILKEIHLKRYLNYHLTQKILNQLEGIL